MWCRRRSRALAVASASAGMITAHGYEATAWPTRRAACRPVARPPHISTMCRGRSVGGSVPADLPEVGLPRPYIALPGVAGQYHRAPGNAATPRRAGGGSGWEGMDRVRAGGAWWGVFAHPEKGNSFTCWSGTWQTARTAGTRPSCRAAAESHLDLPSAFASMNRSSGQSVGCSFGLGAPGTLLAVPITSNGLSRVEEGSQCPDNPRCPHFHEALSQDGSARNQR